ncbi:MAG TPA: hypothetical protein VGM84_25055 [Steroidobacteraceae bacterium]
MSSIDPPTHPLVSDGGIEPKIVESADPFTALDELMQVVEALCPTYPPRGTFARSTKFKL